MNVTKSTMQKISRAALALAVCLLTLTPVLALTNHSLSPDGSMKRAFKPSAVFNSCWVDYDVTSDGMKGMRVHVNFEVTGLKGVDTKLVARVQNEDGDFLTSDSSYSNGNGELETSFSMKPGYPTTVYKDAEMFLPYGEINLRKGVYNLKLDIDIAYEDGELIQHLTYKEFEFTSGGSNTAVEDDTPGDATAKVKKIWVDYNVTENGRKGMRVHVNFEVTGLKGVDAKVVARVQKEDGNFLLSTNPAFSNGSDQLEVSYDIKPGYAVTVYEDAQMFLPYSEIVIRKGVWNLKFDVDLNYEDGELIQHLDYYEFEFSRNS